MNRLRTLLAVAVLAASSAVVATSGAPASAVSCTVSITLRQGSSGSAVTCLESRLKELGYSLSGPDTYFGTTTTTAVKAFQSSKGLLVDGIVGPVTGTALGIRGGSSGGGTGGGATVPPVLLGQFTIGTTPQGRSIVAYRLGTPGGRVVLAIGQTHGDEPKGQLVTQAMRTMPIPAGIELWIIDTMNPDGAAAGTRQNPRTEPRRNGAVRGRCIAEPRPRARSVSDGHGRQTTGRRPDDWSFRCSVPNTRAEPRRHDAVGDDGSSACYASACLVSPLANFLVCQGNLGVDGIFLPRRGGDE